MCPVTSAEPAVESRRTIASGSDPNPAACPYVADRLPRSQYTTRAVAFEERGPPGSARGSCDRNTLPAAPRSLHCSGPLGVALAPVHESSATVDEPSTSLSGPPPSDSIAASRASGDESIERSPRMRRAIGAVVVSWLPAAFVIVLAVFSQLRNEVGVVEIGAYVAYRVVVLLIPGTLIFRALVGQRPYFVEDLALGALTGITFQIVCWWALRPVQARPLGRLVVDRADRGVPARPTSSVRLAITRQRSKIPSAWAWTMATICGVVIMGADRWFRQNPLPPSDGNVYVDQWWHLAVVQECTASRSGAGPAGGGRDPGLSLQRGRPHRASDRRPRGSTRRSCCSDSG